MEVTAEAMDGLNRREKGVAGGETKVAAGVGMEGGGGAGGGGGGGGRAGEGGAHSAIAGSDESVASWDSCSWLTRHSELFGLSTKEGYLWARNTRGRFSDRDTPDKATRDAPLGVLVAADPMLARPLRLALHGLLMRLLVDQELKRDFALAFARLYEVGEREGRGEGVREGGEGERGSQREGGGGGVLISCIAIVVEHGHRP